MTTSAYTRRGPDAVELATLGQRQLELAEQRYHTLVAAVRNEFRIANQSSGPQKLRKVTFLEYEGAVVPEIDAVLEPGCTEARYIDAVHRMFRSNAKTLEGNILYTIAEPQCWPFIQHYHSPAKTTGREDWDEIFTALQSNPRREVVPCMFASTPFGCHIPSPCPFHHPPPSAIQAERATLVSSRRKLLTRPTERAQWAYVRNACIRLEEQVDVTDAVMDQLEEEAKLLTGICDNGQCAKKAGDAGSELLRCSRCHWARYCSTNCQRACWKRHQQVCVTLELLIEEDGLWTMEGNLKGQPTMADELRAGPTGRDP